MTVSCDLLVTVRFVSFVPRVPKGQGKLEKSGNSIGQGKSGKTII